MKFRAPRGLLRADAITVRRSSTAEDSEGNLGPRTVVLNGFGTITGTSDQEQLIAAQRGTRVDKILVTELGLDIQDGDWIDVGGVTYEAVEVDQRRVHQRAILRKVI